MVILGKTEFGYMETGAKVKYLVPKQPDGKDSVSVMLDFKNDSRKTIETIVFFFLPFNAMDHIVSSRVGRGSEAQLSFRGDIHPDEVRRHIYWENVWYSREIVHIKLTRVEIAYTDDSTESMSDRQIQYGHN